MTDASNGTARVPAWKRIGLKLKYAKDTAEENTPPISNSSPNLHQEPIKPGKRPAEDAEPETPVKRAKSSKSEKPKHGLRESTLTSQAFSTPATKPPKKIVFDDDDQPMDAQGGRPSSLRKSVSFTPDTKVEDGFSASNFFKAWVNGGGNEEDGEGKAEESASPSKEALKEEKSKKKKKSKSTTIPTEASTEETKPKDKKSKKSKAKSAPTETTTTPPKESNSPPQPYIAYLLHHHTSKPTWKFNKKHQNNLLKNLFNIYRIPSSHNAALIDYISGLQGSARLRVAQEAGEILLGLAGEEALEVQGWRERMGVCFAALEERIEEFEGEDAEGQEREERRRDLERGKRAQAILKEALNEEEILSTVFTTSSSEKATTQTTSTTTILPSTTEQKPTLDDKPQKRKRKARTDVSSSSSSSESSSSESSSSSSSESESDSDSD